MAKKQTKVNKSVTFSINTVVLFVLAFSIVGVISLYQAFAAPARKGIKGSLHNYTPTLMVTPSTVKAGDYFTVSGCGYDKTYGGVIISFTGGSWGQVPNSSGCISIADIPALSGSTLPAGTYPVTASQYVSGPSGKLTRVAQTTITVQ